MIVGNPLLEAFDAAFSPIGALVAVELSAAVAKHRLRNIIAADREAVPCGQWARAVPGVRKPGGWVRKPRYRWEVRK